jgi:hypothetical protein
MMFRSRRKYNPSHSCSNLRSPFQGVLCCVRIAPASRLKVWNAMCLLSFSTINHCFGVLVSGCLGFAPPYRGTGRYECSDCAEALAQRMAGPFSTGTPQAASSGLQAFPCSAMTGTTLHLGDPKPKHNAGVGNKRRQGGEDWYDDLLSLTARHYSAGEALLQHTQFILAGPLTDDVKQRSLVDCAFTVTEQNKLALCSADMACVKQLLWRSENGFPFGYTYPTYTQREGYGLAASRTLAPRTVVAIYCGTLVERGSRVVTNTALNLQANKPERDLVYLVCENSGGLGRFMSCSDNAQRANVEARPCIIDGGYCLLMCTNRQVKAGTSLAWWYGKSIAHHFCKD